MDCVSCGQRPGFSKSLAHTHHYSKIKQGYFFTGSVKACFDKQSLLCLAHPHVKASFDAPNVFVKASFDAPNIPVKARFDAPNIPVKASFDAPNVLVKASFDAPNVFVKASFDAPASIIFYLFLDLLPITVI